MDWIIKIAQVVIVVPIGIACWRFRHLGRIQKLLLGLLILSALTSTVARYLWSIKENNLYLLHYYTVIEFCGWAAIFYLLFESTFMKRMIFWIGIGYVAFAIINSIFWEALETFNTNSRSLESVLLIFYSIAYYVKMFREKRVSRLEYNASFWINAAVLVYFSSAFLLFGFSNLLLNLSSYKIREVWGLHGIFLIVHYILITVGVWIVSSQKISH
ncbi:hypothetical protein [uncultured Dokdonia sp.]|uniref:hypothetical protein n=1 Tax=uncultured Dokdonia sp. TaxID=575653 RepID=UPI002611BC85|nr:hypothetical protein [uncultured Dokdonia sp.]